MSQSLTLLRQDHVDLPRHALRTGMKLEMVSLWEQLQICPVSVTKASRAKNALIWKRISLVLTASRPLPLPSGLQRRLLPGNAG